MIYYEMVKLNSQDWKTKKNKVWNFLYMCFGAIQIIFGFQFSVGIGNRNH